MSETSVTNPCPRCGGAIPAEAPQGLCPKCLLRQATFSTEDGGPAPAKPVPPGRPELVAAFPHLEVLELVGQGGMGFVFKARQPKIDRFVALKILPQSLAADPAFAERFTREGRVLARLSHPNIVAIHDFGESNGFFYLLMEFVDGVNLRQAMRVGRFTPAQALAIVPSICEALQFAHHEGILHRDIKPENILLDAKGRVKIADFGIAKIVGAEGGATRPAVSGPGASLTETGNVLGTLHYMAPEQLEHPQDVDQRADIYSLGVVFYEMLTGELPLGRFAPPSHKTPVDPRVDEVVLRALEKEREHRTQTAGEVKTQVETISASPGSYVSMPFERQPLAGATKCQTFCYLSTPDHLRTWYGRIVYLYTDQGELHLDSSRLKFRGSFEKLEIPLETIRALSLGSYSRLAKPLRLDYVSVTFAEGGKERVLLLTPGAGWWSPTWSTNRAVAEFLETLREAVTARTGVPPAGAGPAPGPYFPAALAEVFKAVLLPAVAPGMIAAALWALWLSKRARPEVTPSSSLAWMLLVASSVLLAFGWLAVASRRAQRLKDQARKSIPETPSTTAPGARQTSSSGMRSACFLSYPERMRHCFPSASAQVFICRGELRLEPESLIFVTPWQTRLEIQLADLEHLSVGQFQMWTTPWVMKYARVNFLSVGYESKGRQETVLLSPAGAGTASAADINVQVSVWQEAIRNAVLARTGSPPAVLDPKNLLFSAEPAWNRKGIPLFLAATALSVLLVWQHTSGEGPRSQALRIGLPLLLGLLLGTLGWFVAGFMKADSAIRRGDIDAVTSDEPPEIRGSGKGGS